MEAAGLWLNPALASLMYDLGGATQLPRALPAPSVKWGYVAHELMHAERVAQAQCLCE